jgi:hypothetical protein
MITVDFEGNNYLLSKDSRGGYWVGNGGPKRGRYPGLSCTAPSIMWPELAKKAIKEGYEASELRCAPLKKESKPRKSSTKKPKKPTISIF